MMDLVKGECRSDILMLATSKKGTYVKLLHFAIDSGIDLDHLNNGLDVGE